MYCEDMSQIKSLRIIAASSLPIGLELGNFISCDATLCDNEHVANSNNLRIIDDKFFCAHVYKCVKCVNYLHSNKIFTMFEDEIHCLCSVCSAGLGIGTGALKLDEKYIGVDQYIYNSYPSDLSDSAIGCLYSVEYTDSGTEYKFDCILKDLPYRYDSLCIKRKYPPGGRCYNLKFRLTVIKKTNDSDWQGLCNSNTMVKFDGLDKLKYKSDYSGPVRNHPIQHREIAQIYTQTTLTVCERFYCKTCKTHHKNQICRNCNNWSFEFCTVGANVWFAEELSKSGKLKMIWRGHGWYKPDSYCGKIKIENEPWFCLNLDN